jgi:hypothetical protein
LVLGRGRKLLGKTVSGLMLALMLIGMLTLAFNIKPAESSNPEVLFFDDFNDGVADGWTEHLGTWSVINGEYHVRVGIENGITTANGLNLADCIVEIKLRFGDAEVGFRAGIVFRYNDSRYYYSFELSNEYDKAQLLYYTPETSEYGYVFASIDYSVQSNVNYTLKVEVNGNVFRGYINSEEIVSGTDGNITEGKVGLRARRADVFFDNFTVYSITLPHAPYIVIDQAFVSDERADVRSIQTVAFHAKWNNGSNVIGGSIYVNDSECFTNNTGWINANVNSSMVKKEELTVTGVNCSGVATYVQTASNPSLIWDEIIIVDGGLSSESIMLGKTVIVWFKASYEYDSMVFDGAKGILYVNESAMSWSTTDNRWEYNYTATTSGRNAFVITGVSDRLYSLAVINDKVRPRTVIVWEQTAFQVAILSHEGYYASLAGWYVIAGEVINAGNTNANFVNVTVRFYGSNGTILDTLSSPIALHILRPGEKSPFKVFLKDSAKAKKVDHYDIDLEFSGFDWEVQTPGLEILTSQYSSSKNEWIGYGTVRVEGEIKNIGNITAENVLLYATFYDENGTVVDAQVGGEVGGLDLQPNETKPFQIELSMPNERIDPIADYALVVEICIENPSINYEKVASELKIISEQTYIPPFKAQYYGPVNLPSETRLRVQLSSSGIVDFYIQDHSEFEDFLALGPEWAVGHYHNKTAQQNVIFTIPSTDDWFFLIGNDGPESADVSLEIYEQTKWYEFYVGVAKEFYKKDDSVMLSAKLESNQLVSDVEVRFGVLNSLGVCIFNCSKHTDVNGWANVTFTISTEEGNYTVLAETLVEYSKIIRNNASFIVDLTSPAAICTYSPLNPKRDETITFNASASYDELGTIVSYEWDFGDGTMGTGMTISHVYAMSENYTVTLKIMDNAGNFNTYTTLITVEEPFNLMFIVAIVAILGLMIASTGVWIFTKRKKENSKITSTNLFFLALINGYCLAINLIQKQHYEK